MSVGRGPELQARCPRDPRQDELNRSSGHGVRVASFDVFDTVLTRAVGSPHGLFLMLGRRLAYSGTVALSPEAFAYARAAAERRALANLGEPTLNEIYSELGMGLGLEPSLSATLMESELALHAELLRPVPAARQRLERVRAEGQRVYFISDMHVSSEFIRAQLLRHGLWSEGDRCLVSCELGRSKASGEPFLKILEAEGVSPAQVMHHGDDRVSDQEAAQNLGLTADLLTDARLNRYEEILERHATASEGLSSAMAGASKLARLQVPAHTPRERAIRDVAAGVAAPVLVGYLLWVLRRAREQGLKRLYFVSRDGQVLLAIAKRLAPKLDFPCELRYLYGSRLSWARPAMRSTDEQWIWADEEPSVRHVLGRLGISPRELESTLESAGFPASGWSHALDADAIQGLAAVLREADVREKVEATATREREVLADYLRQEGMTDATRKGLVDLGWRGSLCISLGRIARELGFQPPAWFYFGLRPEPSSEERDSPETYFFDTSLRRGFIDLWVGPALEIFCSADHGTVLGFARRSSGVVPVLEERANQRMVDWGLPLLRQTMDAFVEHLCTDRTLLNVDADVREASLEVLNSFWGAPSATEAQAWGDALWEEHSDQTYRLPVAEPYRWSHVATVALRGSLPAHHRYSWREGSLAGTPRSVRAALGEVMRLRRLLSRAKRVLAQRRSAA
jgi:FMN phosphatase YigB (HAD superfamily)